MATVAFTKIHLNKHQTPLNPSLSPQLSPAQTSAELSCRVPTIARTLGRRPCRRARDEMLDQPISLPVTETALTFIHPASVEQKGRLARTGKTISCIPKITLGNLQCRARHKNQMYYLVLHLETFPYQNHW